MPQPLQVSLLSPAVGTGNVGDHFIVGAITKILGEGANCRAFSTRHDLTEADLATINGSACAILCGTNLYQHDWNVGISKRSFKRIRVPIIPFAVGSSAASLEHTRVSRETRRMIRFLHSRCELGSVRDPHTAEVVSTAGVENLALTGCAVLFWSLGQAAPDFRPGARSKVVLTARNWLMHHEPDHIDNPVQLELMRALLDSFPREQLLFAIHEPFDERLVELLEIPEELVFRSDDPGEYLTLYSDPDTVVLAGRLHAGMYALANGVPAVFVGHDTRTYSFCEMMHLPYVELFSEGAPEAAVKGVQSLLDGDLSPLGGFGSRYEALRHSLAEFLTANDLPMAATLVDSARPATASTD